MSDVIERGDVTITTLVDLDPDEDRIDVGLVSMTIGHGQQMIDLAHVASAAAGGVFVAEERLRARLIGTPCVNCEPVSCTPDDLCSQCAEHIDVIIAALTAPEAPHWDQAVAEENLAWQARREEMAAAATQGALVVSEARLRQVLADEVHCGRESHTLDAPCADCHLIVTGIINALIATEHALRSPGDGPEK